MDIEPADRLGELGFPKMPGSHYKLSNGMIISGHPERPSWGSNMKQSGEKKPGRSSSGRTSRTSSGLQAPRPSLAVTGLITSGPARRSDGGEEPRGSGRRKRASPYGTSVTVVGKGKKGENFGFRVSAIAVCICLFAFFASVTAGICLLLLVGIQAVICVFGAVWVLLGFLAAWNFVRRDVELEAFLRKFPDTNLQRAKVGEVVKVTGVVTCGSIPLETSYEGVGRCVYVRTELREYRPWNGKPANSHHRRLTWGIRYAESHAADFYLSDFQSGARALVRAGHGSKVVPFVKATSTIDLTMEDNQPSLAFLSWLDVHHLSHDDRIMQIQEGFIKEGGTMSVIGTLQCHDDMMFIMPLTKPICSGFQWKRLMFPIDIHGLILLRDENPSDEVILV